MKAKPGLRELFHKQFSEGMSITDISKSAGVHEVVVVKTLRHPTPKIKGVNYSHLSLPIPLEEIEEAIANGSLEDMATLYGVTTQTLRARLGQPSPRKTHTRKVDKITDEDKNQAVNDYYQSGRKLNSTTHTPNILKQILDERGVPEKKSSPISSKYVVRLMDAVLSINPTQEHSRGKIRTVLRYLVSFTSDTPLVWKGQVLDLLLSGEIAEPTARIFNDAIDQVARLIGEDD